MTDKCRVALWYTSHVEIKNSELLGIKAVRECNDIEIVDTKIVSPEFGWRSNNIYGKNINVRRRISLFYEAKGSLKEDGI